MELLLWIIIFIVAMAVLIKAADYFTDSAEKISLIFRVPPFIVAVTIVAIGTSLPELSTALMSVFRNASEIVVGNAVGSNIANVLLVIGISAIVAGQLKSKRSLIDLDLPVMGMITVMMLVVIWDREVTFIEGLLSLLTYALYLFYIVYFREKKIPLRAEKKIAKDLKKDVDQVATESKPKLAKDTIITVMIFIISSILIYFGARYTIESVIKIGAILDIAASVIALTAIAIGTSLPELIVSVTAAYKKQYEISLGNIVGSNIFNALVVVGAPAMFGSVIVDDLTFSIGIPFLIGAMIIYIFSGISQKIHRLEGFMYILLYIFFIGKLFSLF